MSGKDFPLPPRAWLVVGLLWVVGCLNYLDRVILITMRTSIKEAIPMTDARFGLLTTVFLVTYGLLSPLGGFVADRFNRSRIIIFSLFAWSAATWLTAHAVSSGELLFYRALMGISEACYFPAAGALIMDYHRHRTRSLANGIHLSGVMVGSGLGGLGGWIAERQNWVFVFELFGAIGVTYAVLLIFLLRDPPPEFLDRSDVVAADQRPRFFETVRVLFAEKAFLAAMVFWGLLGLASWSFVGWLPAYLSEHFQLSQGRAGLLSLGYIYSAGLVGMVVGGAWADRWCRSRIWGRLWVSMIGALLAIPAILLVANTAVLWFALLGLAIYGFARPFPDANMVPILCGFVERRHLATAVGLLNTFSVFIGGTTIYLGGVLRDAHMDISKVFDVGAAVLIPCAILLLFMAPRRPVPAPLGP